MKDILYWHYDLVAFLPDHLIIKMYKKLYKLSKKRRINNLYGSDALYAYSLYLKNALINKNIYNKQISKYDEKYNKLFDKESRNANAILHETGTFLEFPIYKFKEHSTAQFRKGYNKLKIMLSTKNLKGKYFVTLCHAQEKAKKYIEE